MGRLTHTVSGDIASFRTPSRVPIESLKFHFLPKQAAGTPTPENPIPIEGWTGMNGIQEGKNLIDISALTGTDKVWWKGSVVNGYPNHCVTPKIPVKPGASYRLNRNSAQQSYVCYFDKNGDYVDQKIWDDYTPSRVIPDNVYFVGITIGTAYLNDPKPQFELGTKATDHADYIEPRSMPVVFPISGKNLFDKSDATKIITGLNIEKGSLSYYHFSYSSKSTVIYIPCIPGMTYTVSKIATARSAVCYLKNGDTPIGGGEVYGYLNFNDLTSKTITVGNDATGLVVYITNLTYDDTPLQTILDSLQIEYGDTATSYEPYSSDNTFYGGYIDPVAGEIVAEYAKIVVDGTVPFTYSARGSNMSRFSCALTNLGPAARGNVFQLYSYLKTGNTEAWSGWIAWSSSISSYNLQIFTPTSINTPEDFSDYLEENPLEVAYMMNTPIHIPIAPQDLKAFLDHNNFWSDANDITEVTYEVSESRHITDIRKKAVQEESKHHKIVNWNQWVHDGNFTGANLWYVNQNYGSISASNNIMTWTCTVQPTQYYHTGFMRDSTKYVAIPWNHKVLVRAVVRCSIPTLFNLYALVGSGGNTHTYYYRNNIPANEWTELIGFIRDRPETPPSGIDDLTIVRFKACISGTSQQISTVTVGTTFDVKDFVAFDLTQMFGAGNEPTTVAEFERICAINGIDLTTYQPYDTGSDRWLIIP